MAARPQTTYQDFCEHTGPRFVFAGYRGMSGQRLHLFAQARNDYLGGEGHWFGKCVSRFEMMEWDCLVPGDPYLVAALSRARSFFSLCVSKFPLLS